MKSQSGFSLVEILVALSLLAFAGTFVVGKVYDNLQAGNQDAAKIQIRNFESVLKEYRRYCYSYPTTEQGLDALLEKMPGVECPKYPPNGFLEAQEIPEDPWESPYIYESDGKKYVIISYGQDREEGGEGFDSDIRSDQMKR